jgi:hypothetical protein
MTNENEILESVEISTFQIILSNSKLKKKCTYKKINDGRVAGANFNHSPIPQPF